MLWSKSMLKLVKTTTLSKPTSSKESTLFFSFFFSREGMSSFDTTVWVSKAIEVNKKILHTNSPMAIKRENQGLEKSSFQHFLFLKVSVVQTLISPVLFWFKINPFCQGLHNCSLTSNRSVQLLVCFCCFFMPRCSQLQFKIKYICITPFSICGFKINQNIHSYSSLNIKQISDFNVKQLCQGVHNYSITSNKSSPGTTLFKTIILRCSRHTIQIYGSQLHFSITLITDEQWRFSVSSNCKINHAFFSVEKLIKIQDSCHISLWAAQQMQQQQMNIESL